MRNASMKVLKNLVCCAAFICLMFVLAMPAHAASKADELLQLVNAERAQAGVAPLSMGSSALNAAAQARAKELTVNYSYNRPNGSREFTILPEYGVDDVSVGENYGPRRQVYVPWLQLRCQFSVGPQLDSDLRKVSG